MGSLVETGVTPSLLSRLNNYVKDHSYAAGALLALAAAVVFSGVLRNGLVYDDGKQLLENPFVRNPHLWRRIFSGAVWSFLGSAVETNFYRPLHIFSYWLIWRVAGPNPTAYHLFQWLLYMATGLVVFQIGREILRNDWGAFAGSLLWLLHPLHVEAVAWIASVPEVGCGFFYLLGFRLFLRAESAGSRRPARHALAALAYFPALFFKEAALSFPLLLIAYWFFFPRAGEPRGRRVASWSIYASAVLAYSLARVAALGHFSGAGHLWKISPTIAAAAVGLLGQHARLFFWPSHLNVFHTFEPNSSLRSWWPWLTLLVLVAACALRKRQPVSGFLVVWWAVTLLPCLDVRQLSYPLLAERFSYLPSVGPCLALAHFGLDRLPQRLPRARLEPVALSLLGVVLCLWCIQDIRAIPNWRSNETLFSYSLRVAPNAGLVHIHHGLDLQYHEYNLEGARREFETALRLNLASFHPLGTVSYDALLGLGQIADLQGRHNEALAYYQKATRVLPWYSLAYDLLGAVYFPRAEYAKAAEYFERSVQVNPLDPPARFYLGTCWMKLARYREAAEQFRAARELDPAYGQAYGAEARALEASGDTPGAAAVRNLRPASE
jgi:tetratricopeptide (TPR) repeat protein